MENNVVYVRWFKKEVKKKYPTTLPINEQEEFFYQFGSICAVDEPVFNQCFFKVELPNNVDYDYDILCYKVNNKFFIHDSVSIFTKFPKVADGHIAPCKSKYNENKKIENLHPFNDLIANDKKKFIEHINWLQSYYEYQIYNKIEAGTAKVDNKDSVMSSILIIIELLYEIEIKYKFFHFKDTIEEQIEGYKTTKENPKSNAKILKFLNTELNEIYKYQEDDFYTNADQFTDNVKSQFHYGDNFKIKYHRKSGMTELANMKIQYLKRRYFEIKEKLVDVTLDEASTLEQQVLLFHYLKKTGYIKDLNFEVEEHKNIILANLFNKSLAATKKRKYLISQNGTIDKELWKIKNYEKLKTLFTQIDSKKLLAALSEDYNKLSPNNNFFDAVTINVLKE